MRIYKLLNKRKISLLWITTGLVLAVLLIFPTECRNGATNGMYLCIQVLIPSLFPFILLSGFVAKSGLATKIPKGITGIISATFGVSGCGCAVIFLSLIGGYPVGATTIKVMHKEGLLTDKDAERLCMFCVASGPGFLVTYLGVVMTRCLRLGFILLVSQIISVLILGILARFVIKSDTDNIQRPVYREHNCSISSAVVGCVDNAIRVSANMCAMVVIFASASEVFLTLTKENHSLAWLTALIEITNGTKIMAESYPATLLAFVCGFGGLCVHFQIFSALKGISYSKCTFYIFRITQGLICSAVSYVLLKFFPITQTVFSTIASAKPRLYTTSVGCIFLILTCVAFIICVRRKSIT